MATILKARNNEARCFVVVHPLDDQPEQKRSADELGPMAMTRSVKLSLMALRGYLVLMGLLVGYNALNLAGMFGQHLK